MPSDTTPVVRTIQRPPVAGSEAHLIALTYEVAPEVTGVRLDVDSRLFSVGVMVTGAAPSSLPAIRLALWWAAPAGLALAVVDDVGEEPLRACWRCGDVLADDFGDVPNPGACASCADRAHQRHLAEERTRRVLELLGIDPATLPDPLPRRVTILQTTQLEPTDAS